MSPQLRNLISSFRAAQDLAVCVITENLGIPRPESNLDWALHCSESGLNSIRELDGIGFFAHGFGVELCIEGNTIDFDWGDHGEPDGFDAWRLFVFCEDNFREATYTHAQLEEELKSAFWSGEIIRDTHLYYDPENRARE